MVGHTNNSETLSGSASVSSVAQWPEKRPKGYILILKHQYIVYILILKHRYSQYWDSIPNLKFKTHNSKPNTWLQYSTCLEKWMSWCLHDNKGSYKMQRKKERSRLDQGCIDEMGPIDSGHLCNQFLSLWKRWGGRILMVEKKERDHILIGLHWIGLQSHYHCQ